MQLPKLSNCWSAKLILQVISRLQIVLVWLSLVASGLSNLLGTKKVPAVNEAWLHSGQQLEPLAKLAPGPSQFHWLGR